MPESNKVELKRRIESYDMSQIRKYMNTVYIMCIILNTVHFVNEPTVHFDIISLNRIGNMTGTTRNLLTPFFLKN